MLSRARTCKQHKSLSTAQEENANVLMVRSSDFEPFLWVALNEVSFLKYTEQYTNFAQKCKTLFLVLLLMQAWWGWLRPVEMKTKLRHASLLFLELSNHTINGRSVDRTVLLLRVNFSLKAILCHDHVRFITSFWCAPKSRPRNLRVLPKLDLKAFYLTTPACQQTYYPLLPVG